MTASFFFVFSRIFLFFFRFFSFFFVFSRFFSFFLLFGLPYMKWLPQGGCQLGCRGTSPRWLLSWSPTRFQGKSPSLVAELVAVEVASGRQPSQSFCELPPEHFTCSHYSKTQGKACACCWPGDTVRAKSRLISFPAHCMSHYERHRW